MDTATFSLSILKKLCQASEATCSQWVTWRQLLFFFFTLDLANVELNIFWPQVQANGKLKDSKNVLNKKNTLHSQPLQPIVFFFRTKASAAKAIEKYIKDEEEAKKKEEEKMKKQAERFGLTVIHAMHP